MPCRPLVRATAWAVLIEGAAVASAQGTGIRPGLWEIQTRVTSMQMPGAPAGMAQRMSARAMTFRQCVTPEQASRGPQQLLRRNGGSCTFKRYSANGGRISTEMLCRQGQGTMNLVTSGSYTPTSFSATGRAVGSGPMQMTMTSVTSGRRVGDCRG